MIGHAIRTHVHRPLSALKHQSVFIEASKNVTLSGVHINYSPGHALTVINSFPMNEYYEPFSFVGNMNPNVKLSDCTI